MFTPQENCRPLVARILRFVLPMVALMGVYGCGGGKKPDAAAEFRDAVAELNDLGAEVTLNDQRDVSKMKLVGSDMTDADLENWIKRLNGLTALEELDVRGATITDAGLGHLKGLSKLERLYLSSCKGITDAELEHLKGLANLELLNLLFCAEITDGGYSI